MKNIFVLLVVSFMLCTLQIKGQVAEDSWSFGIGGSYPRLMNHNLSYTSATNYGGFIHIQRNMSESVAIRIQPLYSHMEGNVTLANSTLATQIEAISLNLDFLYYLTPCEVASPYMFFGAGGMMFMLSDYLDTSLDDQQIGVQINMGLGADFKLSKDWSMFAEFGYYSTLTDELDGIKGSGTSGLFTDDFETYMTGKIGFNFYFEQGPLSRKCALPSGISELVIPEPEKVDYDKIEELIKQNLPRVITREVVVEKEPEKPTAPVMQSWVLKGVNFRSGSANLTNDSYSILHDAVDILKRNSTMKIEIQGHTDSSGDAGFNQRLSEMRAASVRDFLVANGISPSRLVIKGYGETQPIASNYTYAGRAANRRIEFKVLSR